MTSGALLSAIAGLAVVLSAGAADAQSRKRGSNDGHVRTCSIYGNGCTSAPIRRGQFDYEFRMPGGTWVSCRTDCKTAIREETVDFWETQRERNGGDLR